jgi:tetratricopeptide (TPR) repeat protein
MQDALRATVILCTAAFLISCGSSAPSKKGGKDVSLKASKARGQYDAEVEVQGVDTSTRSPVFARRLYSEYQYDRSRLSNKLQEVRDDTSLEGRIQLNAIKRMIGLKVEAQHGFEQLLEQYPDNALVMENLATCHMELGHEEMAKLILVRAISKNPGEAGLHNNMGLLLYKSGKVGDAVVAWKKAIKLSPQQVDARLNLAALAMAHKNFNESQKLCSEVQELMPSDADAMLCQCTSLTGLNRYQDANSCFSLAERKFPRFEAMIWNHAFALYRVGDLEAAKDRIERGLINRSRAFNADAPIIKFLQQIKSEIRATQKVKSAPKVGGPPPSVMPSEPSEPQGPPTGAQPAAEAPQPEQTPDEEAPPSAPPAEGN